MKALEWYKSLHVQTKINVKSIVFALATGTDFEKIGFLLSYKERIEILFNKLKMESII